MKVVTITETTGSWGLQAQPEEYDATPSLDRVLFDRRPRTLSPDRVALASYLLFGHLASGRFQTPGWHTPGLAQAMAVDSLPVWVQTQPVELYAKAYPIGRRALRVRVEGVAGLDPPEPSDGNHQLRLMRADRSSGARTTFTSLEVSSNAWLSTVGHGAERRLRVAVAAGVVFAEDLEADRLVIGRGAAPEDAVARTRNLLDAVRLGLEEV